MKRSGLGLLLAGLAAYGYYKYSKMSAEEKRDLKEKSRRFLNDRLGNLGNIFGKKATADNSYARS